MTVGERQLERMLFQPLFEDKQFLAGRTVIFQISSQLIGILIFIYLEIPNVEKKYSG